MTTTDDLCAAVEALTEREAHLGAELLGGMAWAQEQAGHVRPSAVWRALARLLLEERDRKREVVAALEHALGDDEGGLPDGDDLEG